MKNIIDFFKKKQKFKISYNDKDGIVTINCTKKHEFKKGKEYLIEVDGSIIPFKVKDIISDKIITSKYFTPAIYVWTSEILQENNIYKVGVTNWQSVFDRVNQTDTTGVVYKPRIVDYWYIDVSKPSEVSDMEHSIHMRLDLVRKNREFVKNEYKEIKQVILEVIEEFNAKKISPDTPEFFPRYYQYIRKELAREYYKKFDKGYIQSACGTGKSYDGFWIYDELIKSRVIKPKSGIVILFVPSLGLLDQTVGDLSNLFNQYSYEFRYIKIGSDRNSTTDHNNLISFIKESDKNGVNLIACTYQSYRIVQDSLSITKIISDFTIYDEVHRTAGVLDKHFLQAIKDVVIPSQKKLSMTATVVKYTKDSIGVVGMENKFLYGECFHTYSTSDGIEDGYLTPIRIVAMQIKESSIEGIKEIINENKKISTKDLFNDDSFGYSSFVIQLIACLEAFKQGLWTHPIYYANTISRAKKFNECIEYLSPKFGVELDYIKLLTGDDSAEFRNSELKYKFSRSKFGLVSNSQCLTEGISVNCVDGIGFIDPRESIVSQTQIYGRGMRLHDDKTETTVIIPVIFNGDNIESKYWKETINISLNMISSNEEISDILESGKFEMTFDNNIRNGIEERMNFENKSKSTNISGGNKNSSSGRETKLPTEVPLNELLSIKFKDIVKGYRKSPRKVSNKISIQKRMYEYFAEYENGISVSLREFNEKGVKKYSKYIKTEKWHIENYSKLNEISEEIAEKELSDFFNRIRDPQKKLFDLIYETTL